MVKGVYSAYLGLLALLFLPVSIAADKSTQAAKTSAANSIQSTKNSTAAINVQVLEPMAMPQLARHRTIRLYLPADYKNSDERYPVLYMHDGQNLFDDATAYVGEWGVDEALNQLAIEQKLQLIVVGIDHGDNQRLSELSPWKNPKYGEVEGKAYADFIVSTLKPYIDGHYRTKTGRDNTAIMGSSLGGMMSHYMLLAYPQVFSKAGIFSPSYWFSDEVKTFTAAASIPADTRILLLAGAKEGGAMAQDATAMYQQLLAKSHPRTNLSLRINPTGEHNEAFWRAEFASALLWLFAAEN